MAGGGSRLGSSLLDRHVAIVDALIVHPFPAKPLLPGQHRRRRFGCRARRRVASAILRRRRKGGEARKGREQKDRASKHQSHGEHLSTAARNITPDFRLLDGTRKRLSPFLRLSRQATTRLRRDEPRGIKPVLPVECPVTWRRARLRHSGAIIGQNGGGSWFLAGLFFRYRLLQYYP